MLFIIGVVILGSVFMVGGFIGISIQGHVADSRRRRHRSNRQSFDLGQPVRIG